MTAHRHTTNWVRLVTTALAAIVTVLFATVVSSAPASASATDCKSYGYACTPGYTGDNASGTWAWRYYGPPWSTTPNGNHNCTLYVAWRLAQAGMSDPGHSWGNAVQWASAIGGGNHTPTVGSIAWYGSEDGGGSGHVAYVEQVSGSQVYIRADNFSYSAGYTDAGWVAASSVDLFLHPHDTGGGGAPSGPASITASNNNGQMSVQVHNFPLGTTYYFCHSGTGYPTGGAVPNHGSVNITDPNQSWSSGLCSGSGNFWLGVQATDGHDYYSNQVTLSSAPPPTPTITVSNDNGRMNVQLNNFPLGLSYYFCHSGNGWPTGGTVPSHSSLTVGNPNQSFSGVCSGTGNFWLGVQATDGHDYYSNQVTLGPPNTAPSAPTGVTATAQGTNAINAAWTAPSNTGGTPITSYTATATPSGQSCSTSGTSCAITGLTSGQSYMVTVTASNAVGTSPASAPSATIATLSVPSAPTNVTAAPGPAGSSSVTVFWMPPANTGGSPVTSYTATANNGYACTTTSTSCTITGLTAGQSYTFVVTATNGVGTSPASTPSSPVVLASASSSGGAHVPSAPRRIAVSAGNRAVTVYWQAPASNGGAAITSYTVTSAPGAKRCTVSAPATSCTVKHLHNGVHYRFTVVARNAAGNSHRSASSRSVTPHKPRR